MKGVQGNLSTMNVADLLQLVEAGRKTGMLRFDRGSLIKQIYFDKGLIIGSNSNDPKEYLGQLLIHYGKLDENQLKAALQVQREAGGRLGEILVSTGVLTQEEVLEVLRIRTLDIIYDLFLWEDAHFELYDDEAPPPYFIRIEMQPSKVILDGAYRVDEWKRYRSLIPSDRALLELKAGWTSSLGESKERRQALLFVDKGMSVAEISYNMHAAPFHVYGVLYELVQEGIARVAGEVPITAPTDVTIEATTNTGSLLRAARKQLENGSAEAALTAAQAILDQQPKNEGARKLLAQAEDLLLMQMYTPPLLPDAVPRLLMTEDGLTSQPIAPQEAFLLSRINNEWDVKSILSICPFREIDSLRMIKGLLDRGIISF
ncbi:MAG TPA: DUF4388 domain-containing protein [Pyrinomonadaceae bacterium]|nr:DUF4388 domain-containing protein [Pyrinomonadaceae bacterium]